MNYSWPSDVGILDLLHSSGHSVEASRERRRLLFSRVRLAAGLLAALTLAWVAVDAFTLKWPLWGILAIERICAAAAFVFLTLRRYQGLSDAAAVGALFLLPIVFLLAAELAFQGFPFLNESIFVSTAYSYAPFLLAAGLSVFPLTAAESALVSLPILGIAATSLFSMPELFVSAPGTLFRLILIIGIAAIAGMGQLRLLIALTEQSIRDRLTGALTRRAGEERIKSSFRRALQARQPLSALFIDLDKFKSINDRFGHDVGDSVLRSAAQSISRCLEHSGVLIRWGGEEFVVLLPSADLMAARRSVERIGKQGIGRTPDGSSVTASIGIAECLADEPPDAAALVQLSDQRMYAAKAAGRNCYMAGAEQPMRFTGENDLVAAALVDSAPAPGARRTMTPAVTPFWAGA